MTAPAASRSASTARSHTPAGHDARESAGSPLHLAGNLALQSRLGPLGVRAKLALSQPADADEIEADRAADRFDSGSASPFAVSAPASGGVNRKCASCAADEDESRMMRKPAGAGGGAGAGAAAGGPAPAAGLAPKSGGRKLPQAAQGDFERFFSTSLDSVRVHDDAAADGAARSIDALAYATGSDIVFRSGQFDPSSRSGRKLLAHELTHVVQGHGGAQRINRTPDAHDTEVRRSQESPGFIWTDPNGLGFSLYNFAIDNSELKLTHVHFLNEIADLARAGAIVNLEVHGHTDATGDALTINMPLSLNRAMAVADVLANAGVVASSVIPHGESSPVADNGTERGRSRNRRVDVTFSLPPGVIIPERPESTDFPIPTTPEDEEDDGWHLRWPDLPAFCEDHPIICGTGLVTLFCALNPEICAFSVPWPWPGGGGDGPEEPQEPEEEDPPTCGDPRLPLTHVEFSPAGTDKGNRMEARPLTRCQGNTVGSDAKRDDPTWPIGWECIVQNNQSNLWARAHLLHFDLHGPGDDARNIIISDKSINSLMYTRVERHAIDRLPPTSTAVLWYDVQVNHFTGPYPRPYFAETVDMAWGPYDPITGADGPAVFNGRIASGTQRQPPPCTSTTTPPTTPTTPTTADQPTYQGPSMGPAPEGDDSIPMPTPATAECGGISCRAMDVYRDNVGHVRDGVFIVLADERIVREMIEQEKQFLRLTSHRAEYEIPNFDPISGPATRIGLEIMVTEEARRRVFTFLYRLDPTMIVAGSIDEAVHSGYAR